MAKKKKISKNRIEYDKQIERIREIYKSLSNIEGIEFNATMENIVGENPKRITSKTLDTVKNISLSDVKGFAIFNGTVTADDINEDNWKSFVNNPSTNYEPPSEKNGTVDTNIIDTIIQKIDNIPNAIWTYLRSGECSVRDMSEVKESLKNIVKDNYMQYEDDYITELKNNAEEINAELQALDVKDTYEDTVNNTTNRLQQLLNYGKIMWQEEEYSVLLNTAKYFGRDDD